MFIQLCELCENMGFNLSYCQMKDRKFFQLEKTPRGVITFSGETLSFEELVETTYDELQMLFGSRSEVFVILREKSSEEEEEDDDL